MGYNYISGAKIRDYFDKTTIYPIGKMTHSCSATLLFGELIPR